MFSCELLKSTAKLSVALVLFVPVSVAQESPAWCAEPRGFEEQFLGESSNEFDPLRFATFSYFAVNPKESAERFLSDTPYEIGELSNWVTEDTLSKSLSFARGFSWLFNYFEARKKNPDWGHEEWRLEALPGLSRHLPDYPKGGCNVQIGKCWLIYAQAMLLNKINDNQFDFSAYMNETKDAATALNNCFSSFPGVRPSRSRLTWGYQGQQFRSDICISSVYYGNITEESSADQIEKYIQNFWLEKLPKDIPQGEIAITSEQNRSPEGDAYAVRIARASLHDEISEIGELLSPMEWHSHHVNGYYGPYDFLTVTFDFFSFAPLTKEWDSTYYPILKAVDFESYRIKIVGGRGSIDDRTNKYVYQCIRPIKRGRTGTIKIAPGHSQENITVVFEIPEGVNHENLYVSIPQNGRLNLDFP